MINQQQHESKADKARRKGVRKSRGSETNPSDEQVADVTESGSYTPDPANPSGQQRGRLRNFGDDPERINEDRSLP